MLSHFASFARNSPRLSLIFCFASFSLLLLVAGCAHDNAAVPDAGNAQQKQNGRDKAQAVGKEGLAPVDTGGQQAETASAFVGDAACASCHPQAFREHQASRHPITLRPVDRVSLGNLAPKTGALPGNSAAVVAADGNGYLVRVPRPGGASEALQFALGSGKSGMTFVTVLGNYVFEMRASYFPHQGKWRTTPGQEDLDPTDMGLDHEGEEARQCIACHTTTLPTNSLVPEKRFYGVGCEACHGAGGAHIAAIKALPSRPSTTTADQTHNQIQNKDQSKTQSKTQSNSLHQKYQITQTEPQQNTLQTDIQMERIRSWDGKRVNDLCGKCHRTAPKAETSAPDLRVTSRFQPYALMLSRCYKESTQQTKTGIINTLSCITCHNPHQNTSHNLQSYEAICLNCHSGKTTGKSPGKPTGHLETLAIASASSPIAQSISPGKVCPVNPRTGCVNCHMPRKKMLNGTQVGTTAPDHFIRVRRPELEAKWAREVMGTPPPSMNTPTP